MICITCTPLQVKTILDEILEKLPEEFNMMELSARAEEKTPYVLVALQECERMNLLTQEMRRSLKELDLGLKVYTGKCIHVHVRVHVHVHPISYSYTALFVSFPLLFVLLCYRPLLHLSLSPRVN